jgi:hypothetical protein
MKFRIDIEDSEIMRCRISLEEEAVPGTGSISLAEEGEPWLCKMLFSEQALRAISHGTLSLANRLRDQARDEKQQPKLKADAECGGA